MFFCVFNIDLWWFLEYFGFVLDKVVYISFSQQADFHIDLIVLKYIPTHLFEWMLSRLSVFIFYSGWKAGTHKPSFTSIDILCLHH